MLTKAIVFLFCLIGVFGLIVGNIPLEFSTLQNDNIPTAQNKEVAEYFDAHNYTVYSTQSTGLLNVSGPKTDIDVPNHADQHMELFWDNQIVPILGNIIYMRHATDEYGGLWRSGHYMDFYGDGTLIKYYIGQQVGAVSYINKAILLQYETIGKNISYFDWQCAHLVGNIVFSPKNSSVSLATSWDAGQLSWKMTYELNLNDTAISLWSIITTLFSFQQIRLGLPTIAESLIGGMIGCASWALVMIVTYKLLAGIVPWISGGSGD